MIDRKQAIVITKRCINPGLAKQISVMINAEQYNNARYFISDELDHAKNPDIIKDLNVLEDYLIDRIENT